MAARKRTVTISAEIRYKDGLDDDGSIIASKMFSDLDVMQTAQARRWVRREFNEALKSAPKDMLVTGRFYGQLSTPPYTVYSGLLAGVNGATVAARRFFDPS